MSFDAQVSFRSTSAYVTDGTGQTYCLAESYPTTRAGLTFGWTSANASSRDRYAGGDPRLAGVNFVSNGAGNQDTFRLDGLSAGSVTFHIAIGDSFTSNPYIQILDSDASTVLATFNLTATSVGADQYVDATGASYAYNVWPASETGATVTISGTSIYVKCGHPTTTGSNTMIAHFRAVQSGGGGGGSIIPKVVHHRKMMMNGSL